MAKFRLSVSFDRWSKSRAIDVEDSEIEGLDNDAISDLLKDDLEQHVWESIDAWVERVEGE